MDTRLDCVYIKEWSDFYIGIYWESTMSLFVFTLLILFYFFFYYVLKKNFFLIEG